MTPRRSQTALTFFPPKSARLDSPCFPPRPKSDRLYNAKVTSSEGCLTGRWQCTPQEGEREGGVGVLHVHTLPHLRYKGAVRPSLERCGAREPLGRAREVERKVPQPALPWDWQGFPASEGGGEEATSPNAPYCP